MSKAKKVAIKTNVPASNLRAAGGAAAGAAEGSFLGPVGAVVGGIAGAGVQKTGLTEPTRNRKPKARKRENEAAKVTATKKPAKKGTRVKKKSLKHKV